MNEVEEYYLQHFGVKGMKWGVRKNRDSKGPRTYKDADGNTWTTSSPVDRAKEKGLTELPNKGNSRSARKQSSKGDSRAAKKQAKKADKALYKEAKKDIWAWSTATSHHNKNLAANVDREVERKRAASKDYDQAYVKAKKNYNRTVRTLQGGAIAYTALAVASITHPEAVAKGAGVVASVLGKAASSAGGAASTAGMYAKYAAKAAVPVSRTVKNRGYMEAILVNSGNALKVVG